MTQLIRRIASVEQLAATVGEAAAAHAQVRITGSDSLPVIRFDDSRPIHTLSTLRMNKLIEHAVGDMTVIVEAGMTLEALQRQLAWHNQWLPIDPPVIGRDGRLTGTRTIGGLIASNSLGPLRFGSGGGGGGGDWRLLIMAMRWVDAAGTIIKGGSRTVKNVAGYSTPRLMIGSCGSLGAIAEVTLRTFSRPPDEKCAIYFCDSASGAEELLAAILVSPTTPAYLQVISGRTFAKNPLQLPSPPRNQQGMIVVAGFLGVTEVCAAQVETIRGLQTARGMESISQTAAQAGRLRLWMTTEPPLPPKTAGVGFRMHARSSEVTGIVDALDRAAQRAGIDAWIVSEAGSGVIRGLMEGPEAAKMIADAAAVADARVLWTQGGIAQNAPHALAQRIKREIDPQDIFGTSPA